MPAYATIDQLRAYLDQVPALTQQTVTYSGAGSFTLGYGADTTGAIAAAASAAAVQAALAALPGLSGPEAVKVGGPAGGPWDVRLSAKLADSAMPLVGSAGVAVVQTTDALLQDCLDRARDTLDVQIGWAFFDLGAAWPLASTRTVRSEASQWLRLPPYKAGSIAQITLHGDTQALDDYEEDWDAGRYYLYRDDGWAAARHTITAQWGYGPAPDAIVQLNLELAVNIWRARAKGMYVDVQGAEGGGAIRFVGGLTKSQQATISAIRRAYVDVAY